MLLMNNKNIIDIFNGDKTRTLRPIRPNGKGYFRVGSIQQITNRLFDKGYYLKVKIVDRTFVDINDLTQEDFNELGYSSKEEYMNEDYNKKNESTKRVSYYFELVDVCDEKMNQIL